MPKKAWEPVSQGTSAAGQGGGHIWRACRMVGQAGVAMPRPQAHWGLCSLCMEPQIRGGSQRQEQYHESSLAGECKQGLLTTARGCAARHRERATAPEPRPHSLSACGWNMRLAASLRYLPTSEAEARARPTSEGLGAARSGRANGALRGGAAATTGRRVDAIARMSAITAPAEATERAEAQNSGAGGLGSSRKVAEPLGPGPGDVLYSVYINSQRHAALQPAGWS